jgi:hypothetical protein
LVDYIFCIIDYHICRDIFGRIDIMFCRLPYVSRGALPLKTLVLYIYRLRGIMQYNQQSYAIYSSDTLASEVSKFSKQSQSWKVEIKGDVRDKEDQGV